MGDTGDVRRANRGHVRRVLWRGGARTKEEIAREAGISLPTANTLLNEMARSGEVVSSKAPNGRAGRTALAYRANEQHGPVLELSFEVVASGKRVWRAEVVGVLGTVLRAREGASEQLSCEALLDAARSVLDGGLDVRQVVLGVPAIVCEGRLRHCDAPELDGAPLVDVLAQGSGLPVHAENDMHHKAYGCYRELGVDAETVTLANFPARVLPGTATVADGRVLRGAHRFAGMIGFIDYGMAREEYRARLERPSARRLIAQGLCSLIAVLDPGLVVCTGDLVDEGELAVIERLCAERIPREYLPRFAYRQSLDDLYRAGMLACALDARAGSGEGA